MASLTHASQQGGINYNLINLLKTANGTSTQEAVDEAGAMVEKCYTRWYENACKLPSWGGEIDRDVHDFIEVCRYVAVGTLHWR